MGTNGWLAIDFDGVLAEYDGWRGPAHVGAPIPKMVARVKQWRAEGKNVKIFTARVSHDGTPERLDEALIAREAIIGWCIEHLGEVLPITNVKDYAMLTLFDDRCVQVIPNTGEFVGGEAAYGGQ